MAKKRTNLKILFLVIFLVSNAIVYYITELNKEQRIDLVLESSLKNLQVNYDILLHNQQLIADAAYASTTTLTPGFIKIMKKASYVKNFEKKLLREKLQRLLNAKYKILQDKGVLQYQFVLPNNESFLRMHKPDIFGDDLSKIRPDFAFTNKTHRQVKGFTAGRITHAFRNIYPIFDNKGIYIGAMEVSFSSDSVQLYLSGTSKIHSHFLVHKEIFDEKKWQRDDLVLKYIKSGESEDYLLTLDASYTKETCVIQTRVKLEKVKNKITKAITESEHFAVYALQDSNKVNVVSFLPIKNMNNDKALGWIVSHSESPFIHESIQGANIIRAVAFVVFFLMAFLILKIIKAKDTVEHEHQLVNDVLNSTYDILFATNFKTINFSNKNFKEFFDVKNAKEFNKKVDKNVLSIFKPIDGHLHIDLFTDKEKENPYEIFMKLPREKKTVAISDKDGEIKLFKLNITKTSYIKDGFYLVTLGDLTKIQEEEKLIIKDAYLDKLTTIYNKKKFEEIASLELKRDIRYKRNLSFAMITINNYMELNAINDSLLGDKVLIVFASNLRNALRETDVFAKYSENQFIILFPETIEDNIEKVCQKLISSVEGLTLPDEHKIVASFVTTQYTENDTIEEVFARCKSINGIKESVESM